MNPQEALKVLRKVVAYQPNQRIDDLTPEAWAEALEPHHLSDALEVVKKLALAPRNEYRPPFIEIGDIVNELRALEHQRVEWRWGQVMHQRPQYEGAVDDEDAAREFCLADIEWEKRMRKELRAPDWTPPERPAIEPARPVKSLVREVGRIRNGGHPTPAPVTHCPGCTCETA